MNSPLFPDSVGRVLLSHWVDARATATDPAGATGVVVLTKFPNFHEQMVVRVAGLQRVPERRCQQHLAQELFCTEVVKVACSVSVPTKQLGQVVRVALMAAPSTQLLGKTPTAVDVALRRKRIAQTARAIRLEITSAVADPRCCAGQSFT